MSHAIGIEQPTPIDEQSGAEPTASRPGRRVLRVPANLAARLSGTTYDGEDVASALHECGFEVFPLGGVSVVEKSFPDVTTADAYVEANVTPCGAQVTARRLEEDGTVRLRVCFPSVPQAGDRTKVPAIKRWQELPFDVAWWQPRKRVPLPHGWTDWGKQKNGKLVVERQGDVRHNVGIKTGAGLVVVDVDRKDGRDGLKALEDKFGSRLAELFPPTLTVQSPTGGLHWYYHHDPSVSIRCSASALAEGVDIRADGGLVVGPGSVRMNGRRYEVSNCIDVAELPAESLELLRSLKGVDTKTQKTKGKVVPLRRRGVSREEALDRVLAQHQEVAGGTRHATLLSVAGKLRNLLADDADLEWAYRQFSAARKLDDREHEDLENILESAKTTFARSVSTSRTTIVVRPEQAEVMRELEGALEVADWLYQRGGFFVRVVNSGSMRRPTIMAVPTESLAPLTTDYVAWIKLKVDAEGNEEEVPVNPPAWAVSGLAASPQLWTHVRHLDGIVQYPVLRPDGTVFATPGYDEALRLLLLGTVGAVEVPAAPTQADAVTAARDLLDVVCDFPFADDVGRAVFIAGVLTPLCRYAGIGNVPLILVDKSVRGCGGSLLVDTIGVLLKGEPLARVPQAQNDEEQRKVITSVLLAGDDLVLIDNLSHPLGGASIDALLTGAVWRDRLLGRNELSLVPNLATFFGTGNNVELLGDTTRRVLRIRLEAAHERPEERADFKYPDLLAHVRARRSQLLSAALTILRAYCLAGRPKQPVSAWGSFEGWSALVASAVAWCGLPDPSAARASRDESADAEKNDLADLLDAWVEIDSDGGGVTARTIMRRLQDDVEGRLYPRFRQHFVHPGSGRLLTVAKAASKLRKLRGRVVGSLRLVAENNRTKTAVWRVETLASPAVAPPETTATTAPAADEPPAPKTANE